MAGSVVFSGGVLVAIGVIGIIQIRSSAVPWTIASGGHRLFAAVASDRKQRQYFYDGETVTLFAPRMNDYAIFEAPATIGATLDTAEAEYGLGWYQPQYAGSQVTYVVINSPI